MTLSPPTPITPAPATAPRHSLLASGQLVTEDSNRWMGGMEWVPEVCGLGWGVWDPCPLDDEGDPITGRDTYYKSDAGEGADSGVYQPFYVELNSSCHASLHQADLDTRARRQLEAITPLAIEGEFWDGTLRATNFSLRGGTPAQYAWDPSPDPVIPHDQIRPGILNPSYDDGATLTAVSPSIALRLLTAALARSGVAARGTIHAPAPLVEAWYQNGSLKEDGVRLITKSRGDVVVSYSGGSWSGPSELGEGGTSDLTGFWAYGTGPVQIRLSEPEILDTPEVAYRRSGGARSYANSVPTIEYRVERVAAVTTDPCLSVAVLVSPYT